MIISYIVKSKKVLVQILEIALMVAMAVLVLDVLYGVGTRYLFGLQASWTEELAKVLLVWVSLLGGAVAYGAKAHLGVDYLVDKMAFSSKTAMKLIVDLLILFFAVAVLIVGGWGLTAKTFQLGQMMMALDIPKGYVYMSVPVSGIFFIIFAIESIFETFLGVKSKNNESKVVTEEVQSR